jgi:hypothetical protein
MLSTRVVQQHLTVPTTIDVEDGDTSVIKFKMPSKAWTSIKLYQTQIIQKLVTPEDTEEN